MSISLVIKKLIAGIIAILMPITTTIATTQPQATPNRTDFHASEISEFAVSEDDFVSAEVPTEDEIATLAPEAEEDTQEAPAPAEETEAPAEEAPVVENKAKAQAKAPVAEWDISDTDEDDVQMYYYDDEEDVPFLDTIAASVKALFVPMTAYAEVTVDEYTKNVGKGREAHKEGIVMINGEGATHKMIFLNWIDEYTFTADYEAWCDENELTDDAYILREYVDLNGTFNGESVTGEYARSLYTDLDNEDDRIAAMFEDFIPVHMVEFFEEHKATFWDEYGTFVPTRVIIGKGVTSINLFAFAFCNKIESITFENGSKLENIGAGAFAYSNITDLLIPASTRYLGNLAFSGCERLSNVHIEGILNECGYAAFADAAHDIKVTCEHIFTFLTVMGDSTEGMDVNDNDYDYFEDTLYYYGSTVTVALDTALYNA